MNVYTQLKRMTPDEYFAYLKEEIDKFKKTPDAIEFMFDFRHMEYFPYNESEKAITSETIAEFLEGIDVLPAFGTGIIPIFHTQFTLYKTNFKGKMLTYCNVSENHRYRPKMNYTGNNENDEF
jgi:hypothetical protein